MPGTPNPIGYQAPSGPPQGGYGQTSGGVGTAETPQSASWVPNWQQSTSGPQSFAQNAQPTLQTQLGAMPNQSSGFQALYNMLQSQSAPGTAQDNTNAAYLNTQGNLQGQLTSLNQQNLRDESNIQMNRANKMTANAQAQLQRAQLEPGFINDIYNQANQQAGLQYGAARSALQSDATARGAINAHGTVSQFQNQYGQFANQLAQNQTTKNRSMADQRLAVEQAQNLEQQYGLDKQDIIERMNSGLQSMGLTGQLDHVDLLKQLNGLDADKAGMAQQVINQAMQLGIQNPAFLQWFQGQQNASLPQSTYNGGGGKRVM